VAHLIIALSSHGFGHIGQTAPVIRALLDRDPSIRITLRTAAPEYKLIEHTGRRLTQQNIATDVGIIQANALEMDLVKTAQAYMEFHRDWGLKIDREAHDLLAVNPDLVISNISYLTLAGASHAGIPAVALGNINWAVIYAYLFNGHQTESAAILQQMQDAYASASIFLRPAPSMPMPTLHNLHPIGPIAQKGKYRRDEILERLVLGTDTRLVLVSLGGMELTPPIEQWPRLQRLHILAPDSWKAHHPDISAIEMLDIPFIDILASCDALIAKPGYGSFTESACMGIPVLYLPRHNWPEAKYLITWLESHGRCRPLRENDFMAGNIQEALELLWSLYVPPLVVPTGIEESVNCIFDLLDNLTKRRAGRHQSD
jgi:hypothetical protein